ncbi:MAG: glycoside hydrolase family 88 protein, partial [Polyangiaceae bacterium]|nr:glycoside hydrolase family 88 protein [Polyangiaceae bacterium]
MAEHPPEALPWDWGEGTLMQALVELHRVTGEPAYADYYRRWMDHHIAQGYLVTVSDRCPPAVVALELYRDSCAAPYLEVVATVLRYLYDEAARSPEGGISHFGTVNVFGATLWLDSLFMFGNVLVRWGEAAGDARALGEYGAQFDIFAALLQQSSGWFVHAAHWSGQDPDVYWARGNAWVTASGYEYLRVRTARGETDDAVAASLHAQVDAAVAAQDPATGLWWTVVNRPGETYLETSASALFALGMARGIRAGLLDASYRPAVDAAMAGVGARIVDDALGRPVVTGISGPTTAGTFADYAAVELGDDISYGVGAVLFALVEVSGL